MEESEVEGERRERVGRRYNVALALLLVCLCQVPRLHP